MDEPEVFDEPIPDVIVVAAPAPARTGSICRPRWGSEQGFIAVRDPFSGETVEIPYREAPPNWKREVTESWQRKKQREGGS